MKRSHSTISSVAAALVAAAGNLLSAQVTYTGVGGRIEQQIAAIQRNVLLAQNGFVAVPDATNNRRVFVRFLADTGRNVTGFDINMRFMLLGEAVPAWLYAANAQNRPDTNVGPLLTGQIGIDTNMDYCRASFPSEYRIVANQLYFIAFQLPAIETLRFATVAAGSPAVDVTYFVTPTGAAQTARLQYRVNTDGYSPRIQMDPVRIGQPFAVRCTQASFNQPAALWFSFPNFASVGSSLTGSGGFGSFLYLPTLALAAFVPGDPDRSREVALFMPYLPQYVGLPMSFQWQLLTTTPPPRFAMSNAATAIIQ